MDHCAASNGVAEFVTNVTSNYLLHISGTILTLDKIRQDKNSLES